MRYLYSMAAVVLCLMLTTSAAMAVDSDIEEALLKADWQQVYDMIDENDAAGDPVLDLIRKQACLCLNEDCPGEGLIPELMPLAKDQSKILGWVSILVEQHPDKAVPQLLAGLANAIQGIDFVALDCYDRALMLDPELAAAYNQRGVMHMIHADIPSALKDLKRATELAPEVAKYWATLGAAHDDLEQYEDALAAYTKSLELMPNAAQVYYNRANTYRSMGNNPAAVESYSRALDLDANLVPAYYNRGNTYLDLGELEKARVDFDRAYDHPQSPPEVRRRARSKLMSLERMGSQSKAPAKSHAKASSDAYRDFATEGMQAMSLGNLEGAISLFRRAVNQDPSNYRVLGLRALCYEYLDKKDSAVADWGAVISLRPEDTDPIMERARLYEHMNKDDEALADYSSVLAIDPNHQDALLLRAELHEHKHRRKEALADYRTLVDAIGDSPSGVADAAKEAINLLESGKPAPGLKGLNDRTEHFLIAQSNGEWDKVAALIHPSELERFKTTFMPVLEALAQDGDHFMLQGAVYSISGFRKMPADEFFAAQMRLLDFQGGPLRFLFENSFVVTSGFHILGTARANIIATVKPGKGGGKTQTQDVTYLLDGDGWALALPPVIAGIAKRMAADAAGSNEYSADTH